jgi:hypothetical protein
MDQNHPGFKQSEACSPQPEELTMAVKQEFEKQLQNQLAVWQAQIKEHQERIGEAGAKAKADSEKAVAQLKEQTEQAQQLLQQVQQASEAAWKDVHSANMKAFEQLQKGWADALKRFG